VGGLFRHVRDLVEVQVGSGHRVGIICDSSTGGAFEEALFEALRPKLALGLIRTPMRRQISPSDLAATWRLLKEIRRLRPDVLHAHGAKGGAYARLVASLLHAARTPVARLYTPHGGSLHYDATSLSGRVYFVAERLLGRMTDAFIFVSQYEADAYRAKVGPPKRPVFVVRNGLRPEEFAPVRPSPEAREFLYIGMLRDLKGPDVFIEALSAIKARRGRAPTAHIVGAGDDKPRYQAMVAERGLAETVAFHEPMPARAAFAMAKAVVIPSRAESMPYIVLEAIGAAVPLVATKVGGIPEIFGGESHRLVPPGEPIALAEAMSVLAGSPDAARATAERLKQRVASLFTVESMAAAVDDAYRAVLAGRH
jgi:glycosyltransferase involved in cell wall biosynthesis